MAKKNVAAKTETAEVVKTEEKKIEGLTKETVSSGVISFKPGSGSQDILTLICKYGFSREKVLKAAEILKDKGKGFLKSDPSKKYNKVAGIIKNLQTRGFKLEMSAGE